MLIIKVGGKVLRNNISSVIKDIAINIKRKVNEILLIHGGGVIVDEFSRRLGIEPRYVVSPSGIRSRYTDEKELEVYVMVMAGKINKELVSMLIKYGVKAIGLSGLDASILSAERKKRIIVIDERGRKRVIDGGYTGKIVKVDKELLLELLKRGYVVVLAPIAVDTDGTPLNVDADQVTYAVAKSLRAPNVVILTDVDGLIIDGELVKSLSISEIDELIRKVGFGMNRKLLMIKDMLLSGVREVIISSGLRDNPVSNALSGNGTVIRV